MNRLTVLTLVSGKYLLLDRFLEQLQRLRDEERAHLLAVDNSALPGLAARLGELGAEVLPGGGRPDPPRDVRREGEAAARQTEKLYRMAQERIPDGDLLILEDDVLLPRYAVERLRSGRRRFNTALISGCLLSRHTAEWLAWRLSGERPETGVRRIFPAGSPKRVFATGFGALLTTGCIFRRIPFRAELPGLPFFGCDLNAGVWARREGLRWFLHGGVRCRHMNADGSHVLAGSKRNARWDILAALAERGAGVP